MRSFYRCILLLIVISTPLSRAAGEAKLPGTRGESVINAFQVMCTLELPSFEHIAEKATAMRMILQHNSEAPSPGDTVSRSKSWAGMLTSGPFVLLLDEMSGAKGKSTSCAIVADVGDTEAFRTTAVTVMKLASVPQPEMRNDGSRSYIWDRQYGAGTSLIFRDFKPAGKPGVMLKLVAMRRSN